MSTEKGGGMEPLYKFQYLVIAAEPETGGLPYIITYKVKTKQTISHLDDDIYVCKIVNMLIPNTHAAVAIYDSQTSLRRRTAYVLYLCEQRFRDKIHIFLHMFEPMTCFPPLIKDRDL